MARPKKPDGEKLVAVWSCVPPETYEAIKRVAAAKRVPVGRVVRAILTMRLRTIKIEAAEF